MCTSKDGQDLGSPVIAAAEELPIVLTVSQFAEVMGIGRNTAYDLVRSGAVKSIRVGRQIRISKAAFLEFLEPIRK